MPKLVKKWGSNPEPKPDIRLAVSNDGMPSKQSRYPQALGPELKLAHVPGAQGDNTLTGRHGLPTVTDDNRPALLVSYYYLSAFIENQTKYSYRDWMMDSGAYSAYNSGGVIDLEEYIACCHTLLEHDPTLTEIIALDVIGSGPASLQNAIRMRDAGLNVIPVFHIGEDWGILKEYCAGWDKVGLSCRFGEPLNESYKFYDGCFARIWPKKCHSFGWAGDDVLMRYPFHSADSTTWEYRPCAFGRWKGFGNAHIPVRGSKQNLRVEVLWWLEFEQKLRQRWRKEMELLASIPAPTVRLVHDGHATGPERMQDALAPSVKLVTGTGRSVKDTGINALKGDKS